MQKSGIPEGKGFGGFPVSGQWLRCDNPIITDRHFAKVYGKASIGAPPMSVPHLDTRIIDGKRSLLFGPFAGFSTKYLKKGSYLDFPLSMKPDNVLPMMATGATNMGLTKYLIGQVLQSPWSRILALRKFMPSAKLKHWYLEAAGQRVQVIKKDPKKGGVLQSAPRSSPPAMARWPRCWGLRRALPPLSRSCSRSSSVVSAVR